MARYAKSVVISRGIADVIAYMDDIDREHEWQPQLVEAEQTPRGPTAIGTRKRYVSEFKGKRLENTYVVEEMEAGVRVVLRTAPGSILDAVTEIRWDAVPTGTRVTMSVEGTGRGFLRLLPPSMIEGQLKDQIDGGLSSLKACLEGPT